MTADTVGGVWSYAMELAAAFAPHEVDVLLATMGAPLSAAQREEVRRVPTVTVRESDYRLEWMPDAWADVARAGEWLLDLERAWRPDVVHVNGYAHAALGWRAPVVVAAHSDVCTWWRAVHGQRAPAEWDPYRRAVRDGLDAAEVVIAISGALRDAMMSEYGHIARTRVIHNARDGSAFQPGEKEPLVFAAGRVWDEAKNLASVQRLSPALAWPVVIAGAGSTMGVRSREEVAAWMARASIYAFPACYEPFGLSILEAALSGCALVLGDIPSLRELWRGAALFVEPKDADALRGALELLIADEPLRRQLQARARERARCFSVQRMATGYLDAYRDARARRDAREVACAS